MVNICHFEVYTETIQSRPCALKNQNNETPVYSSTKGHFGGIVVVIHDVQFFVTFHAWGSGNPRIAGWGTGCRIYFVLHCRMQPSTIVLQESMRGRRLRAWGGGGGVMDACVRLKGSTEAHYVEIPSVICICWLSTTTLRMMCSYVQWRWCAGNVCREEGMQAGKILYGGRKPTMP